MYQTQRQLLEQLIEWYDDGIADADPDNTLTCLIENARTLLEPAKQPTTLSEIMAQMFNIRAQKRELADAEKELNHRFGELEALMIAKCDENGATRVSSPLGTAIVSEDTLPQVTDWDALTGYVRDNDAFHLLTRRINTAAFREMYQTGQAIPGINPYLRRSINLRSS